MINSFVIRKYSALLVMTFIPVLLFTLFNVFYGFVWGIVILVFGSLLSLVIANKLLDNPFRKLLEGKGILVLDIVSTGIIRPFIVGVMPPYIRGKLQGQEVQDIFDREAVFNLATPQSPIKQAETTIHNGLKWELDEEELNRSRFGLFHYPCLIYSSTLKTFLTKDFLSNEEKEAFAEHTVIYLNRKIEELSSDVKNFGRHVVELLKPKGEIMNQWWFWVIIIFVGISMLVLLGPKLIEMIQGLVSNVGSATATAAGQASNGPITPIN